MTEEELVSTAEEILPDDAAANFSNGEWKRLIALARVGLAADGMRRALNEIADGDESACEIAFHALSALPKPGGE